MKSCTHCQKPFEITDQDCQFYKKMDVPEPQKCPNCRRQNRLLFRNFFNLYHRKSDLSGQQLISMYNTPSFPVYTIQEWWSDDWNPLDYGFEPDFKRPVFEQLKALHQNVPRMNMFNQNSQNSEYCNAGLNSKDCYLVFGGVNSQNCCYGHIVWQSEDCFDCLYVYRSKVCYECVDCVDCYDLAFSQNCENCSSSKFLLDCTGCRDCFGCVGLKNKQYYIFNQPHTKQEYERKLKELDTGNHQILSLVKTKMDELRKGHKVKYFHGLNCENFTGDYLYNCKNVFDGYDLKGCQDVRFCTTLESFTDSYDCNFCPHKSELVYNSISVSGQRIKMCHNTLNGSDLTYCNDCYNSQDCFGCVGLKNARYCIFNKQYTKEEYEQLLTKVIEHMKSTGEWGEFFPADFSPFAYNETMAQQYFPLKKEEALTQEFRWKEDESLHAYKGPMYRLPDSISEAEDDVCKQILLCEATGKPYKIIPQELKFLREHQLPLPRRSWEQRHKDRMVLRHPRQLWARQCANCHLELQTTYAPHRPEVVYCEECYLKEVY